ncbi:MAG: flavodoxin [Eubacterium sp.]|nr:flavodoxin [Eubacterium sp.]
MSKVAVVYWSSTGNTEAMANAVAEGVKAAGGDPTLLTADAFSSGEVSNYDAIAFGCPAMGAEELEDSEFRPMWDDCKPALAGKKIALFGSYGWGDGEWMRSWEDESREAGANLASESVIANEAPGDEEIENCRDLGRTLAS